MRTAASACVGGLVGLALGPVGVVLGAAGAYGIAKSVGKTRERNMTCKSVNERVAPPEAYSMQHEGAMA